MQNNIQWSSSRANTLRECKRRYFYYYFLSHEGWFKSAPPEAQRAYLLKKISNQHLVIGNIVHAAIEYWLKNQHLDEDVIKKFAIKKIEEAFEDSIKKKWQKSAAKHINLFEHYYNQPIDLDKLKVKTMRCMIGFFASSICKKIRLLTKDQIITIEEFQSFSLRTGDMVQVKIDLAFRIGNMVYIIDWKTGKNNDKIAHQLAVYSMHALKMKWATNVNNIVVIPVFVDSDDEAPEITYTIENLIQKGKEIEAEHKMIVSAEANRFDISKFPVTQNKWSCNNCSFREICTDRPQ